MKTTEKQRLVDSTVQSLLQKSTENRIKSFLKDQRLSASKIKEVLQEAKDVIHFKYGSGMKSHLINGTLEKNLIHYSVLSNELFEEIKNRQIDYIKYESEVQIKIKVLEKEPNDEIINSIGTSFFSEQQIIDLINKEKKTIRNKIKSEKISYLFFGGLLITVFILFAAFGIVFRNGRFIYIGILAAAIGMITKGVSLNTTQYD